MKKLVLKQEDPNSLNTVYRVVSVENSIEWDIGEKLSKDEVRSIIQRHGIHKVKVVVQ